MHNRELDILLRSHDPVLLSQTIMDVCEAKVRAAIPPLVKLLAAPDAAVRANAAYALGQLGSQDLQIVAPVLVRLLADPDSLVRSEAVDALGFLRYIPAIDPLVKVLEDDEDPLVRASAAEVLGEFGEERALTPMLQALHDADDSVRAFAAASIGLLGTPDLLPLLQAQLESEETPRVKAELLSTGYRLGKEEDLQQLLDLLTNADENLATVILNILEDLASRKTPSTVSSDRARINEALLALGQRIPMLGSRAQQIIDRFTR